MLFAKRLRKLALALQAIGLFLSILLHAQKKRKSAYAVSILGGASSLFCLHCAKEAELKELESLYEEPESFDCDGEEWDEEASPQA
jgi:hypothetical protein